MSNEELESQLSAMFDDELPDSECELLARRLARDEMLRARWGRYAAIGACIRGEHGVRLQGDVARKVSAAVGGEPGLKAHSVLRQAGMQGFGRWLTPLAGLVTAAGVAAFAILWLRAQSPLGPAVAQVPGPQPGAATAATAAAGAGTTIAAAGAGMAALPAVALVAGTGRGAAAAPPPAQAVSDGSVRRSREPDSYVVPAAVPPPTLVPPLELADYIVAHSEYSGPLMRRNVLSALMAGEAAAAQPVPAQPPPQRASGSGQ